MDGARADAGPERDSSGSSGARSPIRSRRCCTTPRSPRSGWARPGARSPSRWRPGRRRSALEAMRRADVSGLSVTMPHKADVAALVDECTDVARRLGAVNCVVNTGTACCSGTNTDGEGFVASLARGAAFDPAGRRCLVDRRRRGGPGRGARPGRGRGEPCRGREPDARAGRQPPPRWPARRDRSCRPASAPWPRPWASADLVVNATPVGMAGRAGGTAPWLVAPELLHPGQVAADLVYVPRPTPWLAEAAAAGAPQRRRPRHAGPPGGGAAGVVDR